jgi:hypothetical protein
MQKETAFKQKVISYLRTLSECWFVKIQQVSIRGTPDIICCLNGYFIAMELKSSLSAEISALQLHNLRQITNAGGISLVCSPETWFNDKEILQDLLNRSLKEAQ